MEEIIFMGDLMKFLKVEFGAEEDQLHRPSNFLLQQDCR